MASQIPPNQQLRHLPELQHASALAEYNADVQRSLETYKTAIKTGLEAMKAIALLDTGGAVATLAFIGHLASIHAETATVMAFVHALGVFVIGAFFAIGALGVSYLTSMFGGASLNNELEAKSAAMEGNEQKAQPFRCKAAIWGAVGKTTNGIAILFCLLALGCFIYGSLTGYHAFGNL
jgi:hypothetical protein